MYYMFQRRLQYEMLSDWLCYAVVYFGFICFVDKMRYNKHRVKDRIKAIKRKQKKQIEFIFRKSKQKEFEPYQI